MIIAAIVCLSIVAVVLALLVSVLVFQLDVANGKAEYALYGRNLAISMMDPKMKTDFLKLLGEFESAFQRSKAKGAKP